MTSLPFALVEMRRFDALKCKQGARYLKQIIEKELVGALAKKVVAEELSGSMTLRIFYHPVHQAFSVERISL